LAATVPEPVSLATSVLSAVVVDLGSLNPIWSLIAPAPATRIVELPAAAGSARVVVPPWAWSPSWEK